MAEDRSGEVQNLVKKNKMSETEAKEQGQKPKTSKLAVCSMVLGILGFLSQCLRLIPVFLCGTAFAFGIIALRKITKSRGLLGGHGFAVAGLIISALGFFVPALGLVRDIQFFRQAQVAKIDDVTSKTTMILSHGGDPNKKVIGISILVTGYVDGSATIHIRNGGEDYPKRHIKGMVYLWMGGDWYTGKCCFEYEPIDVHSGHLTIRYDFREYN